MKIYCMKCRKGTENVHPNMIRTKNNRSVMQSKLKYGQVNFHC